MRENSFSDSTMRRTKPLPRTGSGLSMRTSTLACAARLATSSSWPVAQRPPAKTTRKVETVAMANVNVTRAVA